MKSFTVSEFKARFSEIMEWMRSSEEIALTDNGENLAVITPYTPHERKSIKLGMFEDEALTIHDDFEMSEEELIDRTAASAKVINNEPVYASNQITRRDAAFETIRAIAKNAGKRWRAEGLTDEDIEKMIQEEVDAVRYGEAKL